MRTTLRLLLLVAFGFRLVATDPYYVEASRRAVVRASPSTQAQALSHMERGDRLNAVTDQQTDRFYNVFLPVGGTGWVSSYVVRLYPGQVEPSAPSITQPATTTDAAFHLAIGKPAGYSEIIRKGYVAGYDPRLKIPVWVQYRLTGNHSTNNTFPRTDAFAEDVSLPAQARATLADYRSSGYVRGHMAPAEDMRWDELAERESNLLSNMSPQIGSGFNGSVWKTIENRVRRWAEDRDDITIICGPVFDTRVSVQAVERQPQTERQVLYNVVGQSHVAVPTAFFKIVVDARNLQLPEALAFLVPHFETVTAEERDPTRYLTSIRRIEELTGLDFLTAISDQAEQIVEAAVAQGLW